MEFRKFFPRKEKRFIYEIEATIRRKIAKHTKCVIRRMFDQDFCYNLFKSVGIFSPQTQQTLLVTNLILKMPALLGRPHLYVDLQTQCIYLECDLKNVSLKAGFSCFINTEIYGCKPLNGSTYFYISDFKLTAIFGFQSDNDVFVLDNYDVDYDIHDLETKWICFKPDGIYSNADYTDFTPHEPTMVLNFVDSSFLTLVRHQLVQHFKEGLRSYFTTYLMQFPISVLFRGKPEAFRLYAYYRKIRANSVFDNALHNFSSSCFSSEKNTIIQKSMLIYLGFQERLMHRISADDFRLLNIPNMRRLSNASWSESNGQLTYFAQVEIPNCMYVLNNCVIITEVTRRINWLKFSPKSLIFTVKFSAPKESKSEVLHTSISNITLHEYSLAEKSFTEVDTKFDELMLTFQPYLLGHMRFYTNNLLQIAAYDYNLQFAQTAS